MLKPYQTIGRALALFKAAGLAVPADGEEEKRRLLDAWVQRYGALDSELFLKCSERLASGQRFPRFYDMDAALREEERVRSRRKAAAMPLAASAAVDYEGNKKRMRQLIESLAGRR